MNPVRSLAPLEAPNMSTTQSHSVDMLQIQKPLTGRGRRIHNNLMHFDIIRYSKSVCGTLAGFRVLLLMG